jgi:hypothetical protein
MTEREPPRMRELELRDSELSDLLDAAGRDVAPPDVLARSAQRLSAAVGFSIGGSGGLGAPPIDSVASASAPVKSAAAASTAKGAATVAAAKSGAMLAPMLTSALAAAGKPLLVVALASATSIAVWSAQPQREPSPQTIEPPRIAAPAVTAPIVAMPAMPAPAPIATQLPVSGPDVSERRARQVTRLPETVMRAPESVARTTDTAPEELRSLQAAQAMLEARPADAVQALRAHGAKWPNSWLEEERAALLVEALSIAGQRAEAERALEQLRARNPRSPALPRLGRMLSDVHDAPRGLP